ncbi:MAG TPA: hypothetical protein PLL33_04110 [Paracoccus sp. (in: a-proteobacteria)]|nr:hypothetical protein [Paracoccus sp. (in: a-proteobacteria)]
MIWKIALPILLSVPATWVRYAPGGGRIFTGPTRISAMAWTTVTPNTIPNILDAP